MALWMKTTDAAEAYKEQGLHLRSTMMRSCGSTDDADDERQRLKLRQWRALQMEATVVRAVLQAMMYASRIAVRTRELLGNVPGTSRGASSYRPLWCTTTMTMTKKQRPPPLPRHRADLFAEVTGDGILQCQPHHHRDGLLALMSADLCSHAEAVWEYTGAAEVRWEALDDALVTWCGDLRSADVIMMQYDVLSADLFSAQDMVMRRYLCDESMLSQNEVSLAAHRLRSRCIMVDVASICSDFVSLILSPNTMTMTMMQRSAALRSRCSRTVSALLLAPVSPEQSEHALLCLTSVEAFCLLYEHEHEHAHDHEDAHEHQDDDRQRDLSWSSCCALLCLTDEDDEADSVCPFWHRCGAEQRDYDDDHDDEHDAVRWLDSQQWLRTCLAAVLLRYASRRSRLSSFDRVRLLLQLPHHDGHDGDGHDDAAEHVRRAVMTHSLTVLRQMAKAVPQLSDVIETHHGHGHGHHDDAVDDVSALVMEARRAGPESFAYALHMYSKVMRLLPVPQHHDDDDHRDADLR